MEPPEDSIYRGTAATYGVWKCHTAVFDGQQSIIRTDGVEDRQQTISHQAGAWSHERIRLGTDGNDLADAARYVGRFGHLDGFSIGAGHQFDHSMIADLVGGQFSLAELAVFKGRMAISDIEAMEKQLMKEHGIHT
jgi:hypothetical protein